ncbi:2'-5' RNA ligase [Brevundimonas kwangchunensis]|uniref:2'-5' RNA ligase n=1 Tax=Brevundimonas kwangchunensis TaxID=322163 RepID=A0ABN1H0J0_9CAUL
MTYDLFSTPAGEAPKQATIERLFFGLMLPETPAQAAVEVLEESRREQGLRGQPIRKDRLHITLIHIGDYENALPQRIVDEALNAGASLALPAFDVIFDRETSFSGAPGRYPHILSGAEGLDALKAFRSELLKAVIRHGVKPLSRQDFNPHVTLSYADRRLPERPIPPIGWRPEEFVLIHSEVGRSIYHTLGRWPLR